MNDLNILYHGEARLADWGESRAGGKFIKVYLSDEQDDPLINFRGLDTSTLKKSGHVFNMTISQGDILQTEDKPHKPYGKIASSLYKCGFFMAPKVLMAIGTDEDYRAWIQKQPSAFSGKFSEYIFGEGRNIAAHVRRAGEAGTGYKPSYACIPLTNDEHMLQHQKGESALSPQEEWDKAKNKYLVEWAKCTLASIFEETSMGFVDPIELANWCYNNNLEQFLPREYREA